MNNKRLALIFLLLVIGYAVVRFAKSRPERSFRTQLVQVDTAAIDRIVITKGDPPSIVELTRDKGIWLVGEDQFSPKADQQLVTAVVNSLGEIKAERVVANKEDRYEDYEVGDGQGSRVSVYGKEKLMADFHVGRFSFNQMDRSATSYVKLADEVEVYAVDGFLSMTYDRSPENWRDKNILPKELIRVHRMEMKDVGGEIRSAEWTGYNWQDQLGNVLDSASVSSYIAGLSGLIARNLSVAPLPADRSAQKTLSLFLAGSDEPLTVAGFQNAGSSSEAFLLTSTFNPGNVFASDSSGVWKTIFNTPF